MRASKIGEEVQQLLVGEVVEKPRRHEGSPDTLHGLDLFLGDFNGQSSDRLDDDELVEVTPNSIRLRKRYLDPHERKRMAKAAS